MIAFRHLQRIGAISQSRYASTTTTCLIVQSLYGYDQKERLYSLTRSNFIAGSGGSAIAHYGWN